MDRAILSIQRSAARQRLWIAVTGDVQGVGFRPFVYRLAISEGLSGHVRNTGSGVVLELEGCDDSLARFRMRLEREARPPARIERIEISGMEPSGAAGFSILPSEEDDDPSANVLPDLAICEECRAELRDPADRRHRYPFTTCMHCGPRYSIIAALPFDRERTAMAPFAMCADCRAEYDDPVSRRFHAVTNACAHCGPQLTLLSASGDVLEQRDRALEQALSAIGKGHIVALKAIGGFQLLADARNDEAVARLRRRKHRPAKPFAIMVSTLEAASELAHISAAERDALVSSAAPIVLLRQRQEARALLSPGIAPDNPDIGIMLPTTPLHQLLTDRLRFPVVATSANRSGEPIVASDREALARLAGIADLYLTHDRPILRPLDDSVVRVIVGQATVLRCARGYAPVALRDDRQTGPVLALGGHMKSSLAVAGDGRIFLGPHIGDLDGVEARSAHSRAVEAMQQLYGFDHHGGLRETHVVCDAHPDYHTTRMVDAMNPAALRVPHHFAHVLSVMIENGLDGPVLGVAWDGSGHGGDGTIWGGEFLSVDGAALFRTAHLLRFRLPGGETAVREPRRAALGALHAAFGDGFRDLVGELPPLASFDPPECDLISRMLRQGLNSPLTSSAGRLFDAVSAILGLRQVNSFEGEAAMAVEFAARQAERRCPLPEPAIRSSGDAAQIDWRPMLLALCEEAAQGAAVEALASAFIDWLAAAITLAAQSAGIDRVVLTGGCFQNALLTERTVESLESVGFRTFRHRHVPPNDGGLSVGQAAFAARAMVREQI